MINNNDRYNVMLRHDIGNHGIRMGTDKKTGECVTFECHKGHPTKVFNIRWFKSIRQAIGDFTGRCVAQAYVWGDELVMAFNETDEKEKKLFYSGIMIAAKDAILDYQQREFGATDESVFENYTSIPLAYTTGDNNEQIQVNVNLKTMTFMTLVDGKVVDEHKCENLRAMIQDLRMMSFAELVSVGFDAIEEENDED